MFVMVKMVVFIRNIYIDMMIWHELDSAHHTVYKFLRMTNSCLGYGIFLNQEALCIHRGS